MTFVVATLAALSTFARGQSPTTVECDAISSAILSRPVTYCVALPADYSAAPSSRYPVLYFLHGLFENERSWADRGGEEILDGLLKEGQVGKFIVVLPSGGRTFYVNSFDGSQRYEDFFIQELVPAIDGKYRTLAGRATRGISGVSMGGYGALHLGMRHPEVFGAASAHSAALASKFPNPMPTEGRWAFYARVLQGPFGTPLNEAYWESNSPLTLAEHPERFAGLKVYFDCGDQDRYGFDVGNRELDQILTEKKFPHEFALRPGGHGWAYLGQYMKYSLLFHWGNFQQALGPAAERPRRVAGPVGAAPGTQAAPGGDGSDAETRVLAYIRGHVRPGQPLLVTELYNKVFLEPDERRALGKLYSAFFRIPLFVAQYQGKFGGPPSLKVIAEQFDLPGAQAADTLLRVMESDPRVPQFLVRDPNTGEITRIDRDKVLHDPRFGAAVERQLAAWEGRPAPEFKLAGYDGREVASSGLRGHPVLLYVWFTGCPPCLKETPELVMLAERFSARGVVIVGANADRVLGLKYDDAARMRYAQEQKINFSLAHWTKEADAAFGNISIFPTLFLIDSSGAVAAHWVGFVSSEDLQGAITKTLQSARPAGASR